MYRQQCICHHFKHPSPSDDKCEFYDDKLLTDCSQNDRIIIPKSLARRRLLFCLDIFCFRSDNFLGIRKSSYCFEITKRLNVQHASHTKRKRFSRDLFFKENFLFLFVSFQACRNPIRRLPSMNFKASNITSNGNDRNLEFKSQYRVSKSS